MDREIITDYIKKMSKATSSLKSEVDSISNIIDVLIKIKNDNKNVFVCGNGGSSATASHMVCDLFKASEIKSICLSDTTSLITALTNDIGWDKVYSYQLERLANKGDCVILFSVHGGEGVDVAGIQSKNLSDAIDYANSNGIITIGITGGDGGYFNNCKYKIIVNSNSTPIIESVHSIIAHIIPFIIKENLE